MSSERENGVGRFWLDDEGLLRCVVKEGTSQSREDAEDSLRIYRQLGAGRPRPAVIVSVGTKSLSKEARTIYTGPESAGVFTAVALVVGGSQLARTVANFIMAVSRPSFPMRLFETIEEALPWARAQRKE